MRGDIEGQRIQKDAEILARERLLAARTEFERETRDLRIELSGLANQLDEQKTELDQKAGELAERDQAVIALETGIQEREGRIAAVEQELEEAITEQRARLEQIAGLTVEQAKAELLRSMENEARIDAANLPSRRPIDRFDSPACHRSHTSTRSASLNLTTTTTPMRDNTLTNRCCIHPLRPHRL